jgi:hypothetical protein
MPSGSTAPFGARSIEKRGRHSPQSYDQDKGHREMERSIAENQTPAISKNLKPHMPNK